ncbi:MAG: transcriptional regulator, partial [Leptolyngbyaceae cyanobacterium CRU_2_3]|nr:transcriptional regulator [Leptolyngbyaceae cyanobacterium CRU_2_3]
VMLEVAGREKQYYLGLEDIREFPCEDLRVIDRLWVQYSNGRFGFSVQKRIWLEVGGWLEGEQRQFLLVDRLPSWLRRSLSTWVLD